MPLPCLWFSGRKGDLQNISKLLQNQGLVFVTGIPGIGKSEVVKAYAQKHKGEYRNVLYLPYLGSMENTIVQMHFTADQDGDDDETRLSHHCATLEALQADTLVVIDNFNEALVDDLLLQKICNYPCHVIVTTRCVFADVPMITIEPMSMDTGLSNLVEVFYPQWKLFEKPITKMIQIVESHTWAVELIARLLRSGNITAKKLKSKLKISKIIFGLKEKVHATKDNCTQKRTYYHYIDTLFSLQNLNENLMYLLQNLCLMPAEGIRKLAFLDLLQLEDGNEVDDLVTLGYARENEEHRITIIPLLHELIYRQKQPQVKDCRAMLSGIQQKCLVWNGLEKNQNSIEQILQKTIKYALKDDAEFYVRLLLDAFPFFVKHERNGMMELILEELKTMLDEPAVGTFHDQALLLDCRATYAFIVLNDISQAVELEKAAIKTIVVEDERAAQILFNLHNNLANLLLEQGCAEQAYEHVTSALRVQREHELPETLNDIAWVLTASSICITTNRVSEALDLLTEIEPLIDKTDTARESYFTIWKTNHDSAVEMAKRIE